MSSRSEDTQKGAPLRHPDSYAHPPEPPQLPLFDNFRFNQASHIISKVERCWCEVLLLSGCAWGSSLLISGTDLNVKSDQNGFDWEQEQGAHFSHMTQVSHLECGSSISLTSNRQSVLEFAGFHHRSASFMDKETGWTRVRISKLLRRTMQKTKKMKKRLAGAKEISVDVAVFGKRSIWRHRLRKHQVLTGSWTK